MKNSKRLLSLLLALVLALGCASVTAFAGTDPDACTTCGGDGKTGDNNDATCTVCAGTGKLAYLDLEDSTGDISGSKDIDQNYNLTVSESYTGVSKVRVSWVLHDIQASVTTNKIWDTENLEWIDDTSKASDVTADPVTATFTFTNLSSERLRGEVCFAAAGSFAPTVAYSDKVVALLSKADDADCDNTASVTVTLTPSEDDFASMTQSATGAKYGTYTASIARPDYLTFTANVANSSVTPSFASGSSYEYSTDAGKTWTAGTNDDSTTIALVKQNDSVLLRGFDCVTSGSFTMTGSIAAGGEVTCLTNGVGGDARLTESCYANMFHDCTALTSAPELPSTDLAEGCYEQMFMGCTWLFETPELPATEMAVNCYTCMFMESGIIRITALPDNITYAEACMQSMFNSCKNLQVQAGGEMPDGGGKIFTCATDNSSSEVDRMFAFVIGDGTPENGTTYYYKPVTAYRLLIVLENCCMSNSDTATHYTVTSGTNFNKIVIEKGSDYTFPASAEVTGGVSATLTEYKFPQNQPNKHYLAIDLTGITGDATVTIRCTK